MSARKLPQDPMAAKYNGLTSMQKFLYLKDFRRIDKAIEKSNQNKK